MFSLLLFCSLAVYTVSASVPLYAGARATSRIEFLRGREYADNLIPGIMNARSAVVCSFYIFKIGEGRKNLPRRIAEELIRAGRRGVKVTVILERSDRDSDPLNDINKRAAAFLEKGGVKVRFDSPQVVSHDKVVVIDNRFVYLGSHNMTQAALNHNHELSVLVDSREIAAQALSYLEQE